MGKENRMGRGSAKEREKGKLPVNSMYQDVLSGYLWAGGLWAITFFLTALIFSKYSS